MNIETNKLFSSEEMAFIAKQLEGARKDIVKEEDSMVKQMEEERDSIINKENPQPIVPVPPELEPAAEKALKGKDSVTISFSSNSKLSKWAKKERKEKNIRAKRSRRRNRKNGR